MAKEKFKTFKLFDSQDMPDKIRKMLTEDDSWQNMSRGNNSICKFYVYAECYDGTEDYVKKGEILWKNEEGMILMRGNDIISDWLFDNGGELWEEVLIKNSW